MKILITGAAGFIGSHAVEHVLATTDHDVIALDGLTYAADVRNYTESEYYDPDRVTHLYHDLRAPIPDHMADRLDEASIVWHFASDSHVDQSLERPREFFLGNCAITANLLEWARDADLRQFVQVSTDEVYGPTTGNTEHVEWSTMLPSNPYSASKAAQEAISIAYWRSYGVPLVISNTMNNYGERQHEEKFIPLVIKRLRDGEEIPVHGRPKGSNRWVSGSRCWLHARNHADALLFIANTIRPARYGDPGVDRPHRYNISGERFTNNEIVEMISEIMGVPSRLYFVDAHSTRPGHDLHYGLDGSLLDGLGWKPPVDFKGGLKKTIDWYLERL